MLRGRALLTFLRGRRKCADDSKAEWWNPSSPAAALPLYLPTQFTLVLSATEHLSAEFDSEDAESLRVLLSNAQAARDALCAPVLPVSAPCTVIKMVERWDAWLELLQGSFRDDLAPAWPWTRWEDTACGSQPTPVHFHSLSAERAATHLLRARLELAEETGRGGHGQRLAALQAAAALCQRAAAALTAADGGAVLAANAEFARRCRAYKAALLAFAQIEVYNRAVSLQKRDSLLGALAAGAAELFDEVAFGEGPPASAADAAAGPSDARGTADVVDLVRWARGKAGVFQAAAQWHAFNSALPAARAAGEGYGVLIARLRRARELLLCPEVRPFIDERSARILSAVEAQLAKLESDNASIFLEVVPTLLTDDKVAAKVAVSGACVADEAISRPPAETEEESCEFANVCAPGSKWRCVAAAAAPRAVKAPLLRQRRQAEQLLQFHRESSGRYSQAVNKLLLDTGLAAALVLGRNSSIAEAPRLAAADSVAAFRLPYTIWAKVRAAQVFGGYTGLAQLRDEVRAEAQLTAELLERQVVPALLRLQSAPGALIDQVEPFAAAVARYRAQCGEIAAALSGVDGILETAVKPHAARLTERRKGVLEGLIGVAAPDAVPESAARALMRCFGEDADKCLVACEEYDAAISWAAEDFKQVDANCQARLRAQYCKGCLKRHAIARWRLDGEILASSAAGALAAEDECTTIGSKTNGGCHLGGFAVGSPKNRCVRPIERSCISGILESPASDNPDPAAADGDEFQAWRATAESTLRRSSSAAGEHLRVLERCVASDSEARAATVQLQSAVVASHRLRLLRSLCAAADVAVALHTELLAGRETTRTLLAYVRALFHRIVA